MIRRGFKFAVWAILLASFLLLAYFYGSLPDKVLIARGFFGGDATFAGKSVFTVFRVPLIEMVCAFAIVLLGRASVTAASQTAYRAVCTTLLFTTALKSLLQSLEIVSKPEWAAVFFYLTVGIVAAGIIAATVIGRGLVRSFGNGEFELPSPVKAGLIVLLIAYFGLAIVPLVYFKQA